MFTAQLHVACPWLLTEWECCAEPPRILHYGLLWEVKNQYYFFDKAWYHDFDPLQCPPWNLTDERPAAGLFPQPPAPSTFKRFTVMLWLIPQATRLSTSACMCQPSRAAWLRAFSGLPATLAQQHAAQKGLIAVVKLDGTHTPAKSYGMHVQGLFLLKLLLAIEPIVVLNGALCEHHLRHCPISEQLLSECRKARPLHGASLGKLHTPFDNWSRICMHTKSLHALGHCDWLGGAQVADLEHELDDAYDDLEPVLRNLECKDDNVRNCFHPNMLTLGSLPDCTLHTGIEHHSMGMRASEGTDVGWAAQVECKGWAEGGYCETNPNFMLGATDLGPGCRKSCRRCHVNAGIEVSGSSYYPLPVPRHVACTEVITVVLWSLLNP